MTASYRLGVDFGTSTTVAVLHSRAGRSGPLFFDASPLLPSGVFVGPDGAMVTGLDAERAALSHPAAYEANPKRRIADGTAWLAGREVPVVDLVAAVLARVGDEAKRVAGGPPSSVVLTHPADWARSRSALLASAAAQAGLGAVELVAEPVAAAAYFVGALGQKVKPGHQLMVYDLGAGTFDAALVRSGPDGFEVVASAGLDDVGGIDLDAVVVDFAARGYQHGDGGLAAVGSAGDRRRPACPARTVAGRSGGEGAAVAHLRCRCLRALGGRCRPPHPRGVRSHGASLSGKGHRRRARPVARGRCTSCVVPRGRLQPGPARGNPVAPRDRRAAHAHRAA